MQCHPAHDHIVALRRQSLPLHVPHPVCQRVGHSRLAGLAAADLDRLIRDIDPFSGGADPVPQEIPLDMPVSTAEAQAHRSRLGAVSPPHVLIPVDSAELGEDVVPEHLLGVQPLSGHPPGAFLRVFAPHCGDPLLRPEADRQRCSRTPPPVPQRAVGGAQAGHPSQAVPPLRHVMPALC